MKRSNAAAWMLVLALLGASEGLAQRLSVANFKADKKGTVRAQVARVLCAQVECVPPSRVTTKKKVDFKKAGRERLDAVLTGSVKGKGAKKQLTLQLVSPSRDLL